MAQTNTSPSITRQSDLPVRRTGEGLTHWSPWDEMADIHRQMDDFFSRAFGYTPLSRMIPSEEGYLPDVDIYESGDKVIVEAAVPGYKPDEVTVNASPDSIQIEGERKSVPVDDKMRQHRRSRLTAHTRFSGTFSLPAEINPNQIDARLHNGILRLEIPKSEQAKQKSVKVNIKQ